MFVRSDKFFNIFSDDDVDQLEYHNDKNQQPQPLQQQHHPQILQQQQQQQEERPNMGIHVNLPYEDKRESVMIQPK